MSYFQELRKSGPFNPLDYLDKACLEVDRLRAQNAALTKYIVRSLTIRPEGEMAKDWHAEGVRLLHAMERESK
jgi:hypothetical protein